MLADLIELAEAMESRANHDRSLAAQAPRARVRHYHTGQADAHDSDARCVRALIAVHEPRPAPKLRLVEKGTA